MLTVVRLVGRENEQDGAVPSLPDPAFPFPFAPLIPELKVEPAGKVEMWLSESQPSTMRRAQRVRWKRRDRRLDLPGHKVGQARVVYCRMEMVHLDLSP